MPRSGTGLLIISWLLLAMATLRQVEVGAVAAESVPAEVDVIIAPAEGKGMGVFAVNSIASGTWVCSYHGVLTTDEELERRYQNGSPGLYVFNIDKDFSIDAQNSTHFSRYFNHAEHGNMDADGPESEQRVDFITNRDVAKGEE